MSTQGHQVHSLVKCPSCSGESDVNAVQDHFQECLEQQLRGGVKVTYPNVQAGDSIDFLSQKYSLKSSPKYMDK